MPIDNKKCHRAVFGLIAFLLLFASSAFGQGARFDSVAQKNVQGFLAPIPGATITVCTSAGTGTPCTPVVPTSPVTLCTDSTCSVAAPNPFLADSNGNFGFYALAATTYKVSITAPGVTGQLLTVVMPMVGGGVGTFTNITATGTIQCKQFMTVACVDGSAYAQTDVGINQAITDLVARNPNGGEVWLIPGAYSIAATINVSNVNNVLIKCLGHGGGWINFTNGNVGACNLNWTPVGGGPMIKFLSSTAANPLTGGGVMGMHINCNSQATIGIQISNAFFGEYSHNFYDECTTADLKLDTNAGTGNFRATQSNVVHTSSFKNTATSGIAILDDANNDTTADTAFNHYLNLRIFYKNGDGIYFGNSDSATLYNVVMSRAAAGTGVGLHLSQTKAGSDSTVNTAARGIRVKDLDPGAGGLKQDGCATANSVDGYLTYNGAPLPIAGTTVTNGSITIKERGIGTSSNIDVVIQGANGGACNENSTSTIVQYDTLDAAGHNQLLTWASNGAQKWFLGQTNTAASFLLDDNAGHHFVAAQGGNTDIYAQGAAGLVHSIAEGTTGILWGVVAQTSQKTETGTADANVLTFTPPSTADTYRVCTVVSVSSATAGTISWNLSWTDSNGTAQSNIVQNLTQIQPAGTPAPAQSFTTSAAGNYSGCTTIDVNNAAANVVVKWVGGGTTAAKVSATIERII